MTDETDKDGANRRGHVRRLVIMGGTIIYNDGKNTLPCRVRDISETGAKLEFTSQQILPHSFELQIRGLPPLKCKLRWVNNNRAGVHFAEDEE